MAASAELASARSASASQVGRKRPASAERDQDKAFEHGHIPTNGKEIKDVKDDVQDVDQNAPVTGNSLDERPARAVQRASGRYAMMAWR